MKGVVAFLSVLALAAVFCQGFAKIDPKTIVGYWPLDEGVGDIAKDASGNGHDGKLINGPKWVDGKFGKALRFDGQQTYVEISSISTPPIFTFACWFKKLGKGQGGVPRIHSRGSGPWSIEFGIGLTHAPVANQLGFWLSFTDGSSTGWHPVFEPKDGIWYHTAFSYDGEEVAVYVDGKKLVSREEWANRKVNSGISRIGCHAPGGDCFDGVIDEVVIFNVALTEAEVLDLMKGVLVAVSPVGKLATVWGAVKNR